MRSTNISMSNTRSKRFRQLARDFNRIYRKARENDVAGLRRMVDSGRSVSIEYRLETPTMRLARKGNDKAVNLLIDQFGASLDEAAMGYAMSGNHDKVAGLHAIGARTSHILSGYARCGNEERITHYLMQEEDYYSVIVGLALGGHDKLLARIMDKYKLDGNDFVDQLNFCYAYSGRHQLVTLSDAALHGYAAAGNHEKVEEFLAKGCDPERAVNGYAYGGYEDHLQSIFDFDAMLGFAESKNLWMLRRHNYHPLHPIFIYSFAANGLHSEIHRHIGMRLNGGIETYTINDVVYNIYPVIKNHIIPAYQKNGYFHRDESLLKLLLDTPCQILREKIANAACSESKAIKMLKRVDKILWIMYGYQLSYRQAICLETKGLRFWLLAGRDAKPALPSDLVKKIANHLVPHCSTEDINAISSAVMRDTHQGARQLIKQKYQPGFLYLFGLWGDSCDKENEDRELAELDSNYANHLLQ